jgi:hypothetical protein
MDFFQHSSTPILHYSGFNPAVYSFSFTMPNNPNIILDKPKKNIDFYFIIRNIESFECFNRNRSIK